MLLLFFSNVYYILKNDYFNKIYDSLAKYMLKIS